MTDARYTIGIDFGTLSARAVLVDVADGRELAAAEHPYAHGVIEQNLPGSERPLAEGSALQDPADYLDALTQVVRRVRDEAGVAPEAIIGLGLDFTSCTLLPTTADGQPLCFDPRFRAEPFAWVQLWKQHTAVTQAARLNDLARARREPFLARYGGHVSPEWFFPKVWQLLDDAPAVYAAADRLIEAGDWLVWQLAGQERRSASIAGYKALWDPECGFPEPDFFAALDPRLATVVQEKMSRDVLPPGRRAGGLTPEVAGRLGLAPGTSVAVANIDAHAVVPACGVTRPGALALAMGTSICHLTLSDAFHEVPGISGAVRDGLIPGTFGYEAGQRAAGDLLAWFVGQAFPAAADAEAQKMGLDAYAWLNREAATLTAGASGLIALDWWNGSRALPPDAAASGLLLGYTLDTRPEEVYLALVESIAYGTQAIVAAFERAGLAIDELRAAGGLAERNPLLLQVLADVAGKPIRVAGSAQAAALGSAMFAAVAAGPERGGHPDIVAAARQMAHLAPEAYRPVPERQAIYLELYAEYQRLSDHFGRGGSDAMGRLSRLRRDARVAGGPPPFGG